MQTKKPRSYTWAALLFVMVSILAFSSPIAKADAHFEQCGYVGSWYCPDNCRDQGCIPWYPCTNPPAWPFSTKCYEHWGMTDVPNPCN